LTGLVALADTRKSSFIAGENKMGSDARGQQRKVEVAGGEVLVN
jgi:hypothetical protein